MPELPEVETVRRSLELVVLDKRIESVEVFYQRMIRTPVESDEFKLLIQGQTIRSIGRRGKYLLFYLDDVVLISHLRMEGKYLYQELVEPIDKHTHVIFSFTDGTRLLYRDVRKFGTMDVVPLGMENDFMGLKKLGQEPISSDFDQEKFIHLVQKKNSPIKQILLDQEVVSGLGNIYVDDSLALAKIHPLRPGSSLNRKEIIHLIKAMKSVLEKAIEKGGSTIRSFESFYGRGSMQDHLIVYGRQGLPCYYCGTMIKKIKVVGRGTHFCPTCQRI